MTRDSSSATLRAFEVIEAIVRADRPLSLTEVIAAVALRKPTVYRILTLLVHAGLLLRELDGKGYIAGPRLAHLGVEVLRNSAVHGARHAILQRLVDELGETCNFTMLDGSNVVYLDRVETTSPLRVNLQPGSRVPLHCSASGKLFLAMMPRAQRDRLLDHLPLVRHTENTITERTPLEQALEQIRRDKMSTDNQEYIAGLVCVAVPVMGRGGRPCASVAMHAPVARMPLERAVQHLPTLRQAAKALTATLSEIDAPAQSKKNGRRPTHASHPASKARRP
jgi:DNA-binding IclR family transcriptional regulator